MIYKQAPFIKIKFLSFACCSTALLCCENYERTYRFCNKDIMSNDEEVKIGELVLSAVLLYTK